MIRIKKYMGLQIKEAKRNSRKTRAPKKKKHTPKNPSCFIRETNEKEMNAVRDDQISRQSQDTIQILKIKAHISTEIKE